jgi:hypothetical protein
MDPAIETHLLSKRFGSVTAVDELSLNVARGEIYSAFSLRHTVSEISWRRSYVPNAHLHPNSEPALTTGPLEELFDDFKAG